MCQKVAWLIQPSNHPDFLFGFQVPAGAPIFNVGETGDFLSFGSKKSWIFSRWPLRGCEGMIGQKAVSPWGSDLELGFDEPFPYYFGDFKEP